MEYSLNNNLRGYELVSEVIVSSATTSVTFSSLNFGKEDDLLLVFTVAGNANGNMYMFVNNNTTLSNYYYQRLIASSTSVSGARGNIPYLNYLNPSREKQFMSKIKLTNNGYFTAQHSITNNFDGSDVSLENYLTTSTFTISSITQLSITCETANGIGIGSRFQLYKRVAPIVYDYTVAGSAITQLDITGLSIDKGSEYMLVVSSLATGAVLRLTINGNNTLTNYYCQTIGAINTSIAGGRFNAPYLNEIGNPTFANIHIKHTNNGYFTFQSNSITDYGSSIVKLGKSYGTSTFTISSITSITIASASFPVGSRFQLIKLK